jgi:adenylosuccinate synthase
MNEVRVEPIYKAFKGWFEALAETPQYHELPKDLIDFVDFLEAYLKVPVTMISTGPEREKLIIK